MMSKKCYNDFKEELEDATRRNNHTFARVLISSRYGILREEYEAINTLESSSIKCLVVTQIRDELDRVLKTRLFELLGDRDATEIWNCL